MICRVLVGVAVLFLGVTPRAGASVPEGPRISLIMFNGASSRIELSTMGLHGEGLRVFSASDRAEPEDLSWPGDGATLAFSKNLGLRDQGIYTVPAEGGKHQFVSGTKYSFQPVFSPDGQRIAFARLRVWYGKREGRLRRFASESVWLVDAQGGLPVRLTPWRAGLLLSPSSFSPDGSVLALSRESASGMTREAVALRLADRSIYSIAKGSTEPVFSPDGSQIAMLRIKPRRNLPELFRGHVFGSDVVVARPDGSGSKRLTHSPNVRETSLSWDPSGERLIYIRRRPKLTLSALFGIGSPVIQMNADGTCRHRLLREPDVSYRDIAWQPGPGREAGPISC